MPEGHTIHRLARELDRAMVRRRVVVSSPQGRFADGAAKVSGRILRATEGHGKHLFLTFSGAAVVHVHLGLYGKLELGRAPAPPVRGALRMRLETPRRYGDLRGPTACELLTPAEAAAITDRLGPDPLRVDADPRLAWARLSRSSRSMAALLMDQSVLSGVGNVYRAEVLFRHGIDPMLPGRELDRWTFDHLWADLVHLMARGVEQGRIDTIHTDLDPAAAAASQDQLAQPGWRRTAGNVWVYRRTDEPCYVCDTPVRTAVVETRNLYWCPTCQASSAPRRLAPPVPAA